MNPRLIVFVAACVALCASEDFSPAPVDYDKFDWTLTKLVAALSPKNFMLSPLGLKLALAILSEAALGITQNELSSVLGFDSDRSLVRNKFSTIIESLQSTSPQYILNLGNRIYIGDNVQPRPRFAAVAEMFYKTELQSINFDNPVIAAQEINTWVFNITQGRIPTIVDKNDMANNLLLVLNALYFKGSWVHQFAPDATIIGQFYISPQIRKSVPFMNIKDKFYYTESAKYDAKILRMPYLGNKYAMYIIVPGSVLGLPRILNDLDNLRLELNSLRESMVDIALPKLKFDYTSQLDDVLRQLGVKEAFKDTASFPGIARSQELRQRLKVSKVLQRSSIEVNELGSVAYTKVDISKPSLVNGGQDIEADKQVIANRPFLFFIQDEATRQLLFTGRVVDPSLTDGAFKLFTN